MSDLPAGPWRGDWALVTGASSGIGREFCAQLAAAGMHLVLVARREALLDALARELAARHGIETLVVAEDLSVRGAGERVHQRVAARGVRVRLLVNNAAVGPWGPFETLSAETCEALAHLVAATPMALAALFLPTLAAFPGSAIINVSSQAALQPIPYLAGYAAAKACLHHFSLALHEEWRGRGVHVQTLVPAPTATEFDAKGGAYPCALPAYRAPAAEVVRASLARLASPAALVSTAAGLYRQRLFAGLFPPAFVVRKVGEMFRPPAAAAAPPAPGAPSPGEGVHLGRKR